MKKLKIRKIKIILLASIILFLVVGVSTTLALLQDKKEITNTFIDPIVEVYIEETLENGVKSDVYVYNYSDIPMYVRAAIIANYTNNDGDILASAPISNLENSNDYDYTLLLGTDGWIKGSDGYYYYIYPIDTDESTSNLIDEAYPNKDKIPNGANFNIDIVVSSIQAMPSHAILEQWNSGVSNVANDGTLTIK